MASQFSDPLASFPLFRSLQPDERAALSAKCSQRPFHRNDWIIGPHETNANVYFVLRGVLRLQMPRTAGREVIFREFEAGDYFGGVSTMHGQPRGVGVLALTDGVLLRMRGSLFRETIHQYPDVCDQVLVRLSNDIRQLANRVNEFSTLDVRHRLYAELLRQSRPKNGSDGRAVISPPPLQAKIAACISARREPVTREMKALERAGLLRRSRGLLEITDTRRLHAMIEDRDG
jgi:CRP/FNR family cyclic AMP-dependent transcriptional regulator